MTKDFSCLILIPPYLLQLYIAYTVDRYASAEVRHFIFLVRPRRHTTVPAPLSFFSVERLDVERLD